MARKHILLFTILAICSIASGAVFGLLDLFGFVDGRHTLSLALLVFAALLLYITLLTLFLIESPSGFDPPGKPCVLSLSFVHTFCDHIALASLYKIFTSGDFFPDPK